MIKKLSSSLSAKLLLALLLALLCSLAVFFAVNGVGRYTVENIYMSRESVAARKAEIYSKFSAYVKANQVSGRDPTAVARWTSEYDYVTIFVYSGQNLNFGAGGGKAEPFDPASNSTAQYSGQYGKLYPLRFADGMYQIAISDTSQNREYSVNNILAVSLASISFIAVILWYIRRITMRIISLAREAVEVGAGDLERPISAKGEDEIAMLAQEMDNMRRSLIQRMSSERQAWENNAELVTALSHDLRTPLTSMIGYLGILKENPSFDENARHYTNVAYEKALSVKNMTDDLFKYFLVFGSQERLDMELEAYDAGFLLEQLLGELEFDLRDAGFDVRRIDVEGQYTVAADPKYLKRVTDNLVSNAKKYADKKHPVMILSQVSDGQLSVCTSNHIAKLENPVESTKIGLRTCAKIMEYMQGSFTTRSDGAHFAAEFSLPIK